MEGECLTPGCDDVILAFADPGRARPSHVDDVAGVMPIPGGGTEPKRAAVEHNRSQPAGRGSGLAFVEVNASHVALAGEG
jgi:hypothetical protein